MSLAFAIAAMVMAITAAVFWSNENAANQAFKLAFGLFAGWAAVMVALQLTA